MCLKEKAIFKTILQTDGFKTKWYNSNSKYIVIMSLYLPDLH